MTMSVGTTHTGHTLPGTTTSNTTSGGGSASTTTPAKVTKSAAALGGPAGNAVGGVAQLNSSDLKSVLQGLVDVLQKLVDVLKQMQGGATGGAGGGCGMSGCGGGKAPAPITPAVKGVSGDAISAFLQPAPVAAPAPAPAAVAPAQSGGEDHQYEQRVLDLVNQARAQRGLAPLTYSNQLDAASEKHNTVQASSRSMAHIGIGDGDPGQRIRAEGWGGTWGENVAVGQTTPEQVVAEWLNSPTHAANILNPGFRYMGVSYATTSDGFAFWAQSFGG